MAVKIKLMRMGKIRAPYYRIVVADARTKRDGRAIEQIGKYHPKQEPSLIEVDSERAQHWLRRGAQPTDPVLSLLKVTGDWQKFRGEPGSEGTLKTAAAKPGKKDAFAAALKEVHGESTTEASRPKSRGKKADSDAKKADGDAKKADAEAKGGKTAGKAEKAADKAGKETGKASEPAEATDAEPKAGDGSAKEGSATKGSATKGSATKESATKESAGKDSTKDSSGTGSSGTGGAKSGGRSAAAKGRGADTSPEKADAEGSETAPAGKAGSGD